ncbi:hypothetical protein FFLO_01104 [Filobasidium floriforme]|uniref:Dynamin N-terminal domain-containing protein n=1 Tax=Filobasidium floriforme TaxID=5210 RepID=A0A8K0JQ50_9TREE|nr:hypothetical protein FFLO_01104 [Filobasidium floriforme]
MSQPSRLRPERTPQFKSMQVFRKRLIAAGHLESSSPKHMKRIVVIGSQSAGKSALVSMLTGIKLESSIKATTRGLTVFRFVKGEEQGGYKLWPEFIEDAKGPLPRPTQGDQEICRKIDVPAKIKDLHRLVLRPEFDDEGEFLDTEDISSDQRLADINPTFFTENRVVVEKVNPDMPDVEIIDLPGLQVSSQHPHVLDKIRKITQENLRMPNTFAVGVCPATTEPESQDVLNVVRAWDPSFSKTLIALSRSDELSGNECAWEEMISTHPGSFCFIISLPPSGVAATLEELEREEKSCFDNMLKSNKSFVHKVPQTILGIQSLRKLVLAKIFAAEKTLLLSALSKLRSELALLTESSGQWKRSAVIGEINAHIDIAARVSRT